MGFWILSIIIVVALSVGIGYGMYWISKLFKDFDEASGEAFGGFTGMSVGAVGALIVLFSMMNSCTSKYSTYEELFTDAMPYYLIIISFLIIGFFIWYYVSSKKELANKEREEREFVQKHGISKEEYQKQAEKEKQRALQQKNDAIKKLKASLNEKYGQKTSSFNFSKSPRKQSQFQAYVYEKARVIIVLKESNIVEKIPFSSILDFSVDEEIMTIGGNRATTTTKTSTGSMVKRGLVGGVLLGGVGALAGAATAKQTSETVFDEKEERRFYSIPINIDSIEKSIYTMYFGQDSNQCKKVAGVLRVILKRNNEQLEHAQLTENLLLQEEDQSNVIKRDPLFEEVAREVVMSGSASTSAIQRRYEIGYNRAGMIMDQLEAAGIVGPAIGGKPRDVLVDVITLEDMLNS